MGLDLGRGTWSDSCAVLLCMPVGERKDNKKEKLDQKQTFMTKVVILYSVSGMLHSYSIK